MSRCVRCSHARKRFSALGDREGLAVVLSVLASRDIGVEVVSAATSLTHGSVGLAKIGRGQAAL